MAGFIYAVIGIIYAVLLALVVIAVWEEHEAAKATVGSEANELAEVFWLARRFQDPEGPASKGSPAPTRAWWSRRSGRWWSGEAPALGRGRRWTRCASACRTRGLARRQIRCSSSRG